MFDWDMMLRIGEIVVWVGGIGVGIFRLGSMSTELKESTKVQTLILNRAIEEITELKRKTEKLSDIITEQRVQDQKIINLDQKLLAIDQRVNGILHRHGA